MNFPKLFFSLAFILFITSVSAQSKVQLAKMKQRLMTELKIDNVKADSVMNIVQDFYSKARSIKGNADLKDEERKTSLQTNRKSEMVRLQSQGLSNDQLRKLKQLMDEMRQERQHHKTAKDSTSA